ncbi:FAD-dependent monooxygenase [Herbiconiux moechotypicola]|uniref:FAD-dependent oxidoreductase n=1 Tax=Herbiconiux moechotypicola TaxID=637393 RepID=A0ABP5QMG9_9MICO|nr:FAD-dependent monooxygenase [Herbiconiux moechotypicola]MCS5730359.1 FAD-dependent monooxygenase [Herbiconiux moechotypicola]
MTTSSARYSTGHHATDRTWVDRFEFPRSTPPQQIEVLIVGAGPSGLGTALELTRHGVSVAVVDSATEATLVRAGAAGVSARSVEIFRTWGVAEQIRDNWTVPPEWNKGNVLVTSVVGHVLGGKAPDAFSRSAGGPVSREDGVRRPQTVFQKVFLDRLAELGVPVAGGWRVEAVDQDADGVTSAVVHVESGERREIRSAYVVGADGSKSTVRGLAGIGRSGEYATERHWRYVVRTVGGVPAELGPAPSASNIVFNDHYSGFVSALNETDWRAYAGPFPVDYVPSEEELIEGARKGFGFDADLEVVSLTGYYKSTRIADRFVSGRIALVGDAAHVRTPGGNLSEGFGDVANLGWKLAAVLQGAGGAGLLDSYDQERRVHNERVADHALARAIANDEALAEVRAVGVPADDDTSAEAAERRAEVGRILARDFAFALGVVFDERYDASSAIVYDEGQRTAERPWTPDVYVDDARPGHRAPNGAIEASGVTLYGRLGSAPALLVLTDDTTAVDDFARASRENGLPLDVLHLTEPEVRALYGADYALVRPDHHVAWHGVGQSFDAAEVLATVYGHRDALEAGHEPEESALQNA